MSDFSIGMFSDATLNHCTSHCNWLPVALPVTHNQQPQLPKTDQTWSSPDTPPKLTLQVVTHGVAKPKDKQTFCIHILAYLVWHHNSCMSLITWDIFKIIFRLYNFLTLTSEKVFCKYFKYLALFGFTISPILPGSYKFSGFYCKYKHCQTTCMPTWNLESSMKLHMSVKYWWCQSYLHRMQ